MTAARNRAAGRSLRGRDVALLVPAMALGVLLLAVLQTDATGSPISQMLSRSALASLVPGATEAAPPPAR